MPYRFLTIEELLEIHASRLERYGGSAGIRSRELLESAEAMPRASFGGELVHPDAPAIAAAYTFFLAKNHAFTDGNKRVAFAAADVFLAYNGLEFTFDEDEPGDLVERVAAGQVSKEALTEIYRSKIAILGDGDC